MSPLARSLLALAALLAAADAQDCVTKIIGRVTDVTRDLNDVQLPYGPSEIQFNDYCPSPLHLVGERITVCNNSRGGRYPPPVIHDRYGQLTPVDVECSDPSGCTAGPMVEYCG